jgi:hypothetical protein
VEPMSGERKLFTQRMYFPACPSCGGRPFTTVRAYFPMTEEEKDRTLAQLKAWSDQFYDKHFQEHLDEIDDELDELLEGG